MRQKYYQSAVCYDTVALAEEKQELQTLVKSLVHPAQGSAEKTKLMTKSANGIRRKIKVKQEGQDGPKSLT